MNSSPPLPSLEEPVSAKRLAGIGLFGGLDRETLELLANALPRCVAEVGDRVIAEGETARELYIVLEGELEVLKRSPAGSEVRVSVLRADDWFGEMSIIDVQPRSASVRARTPSTLLRLSAEQVDRLLYRRDVKAYALLVMNIARELSRRLRVSDGILAQLLGSVTDEYMQGS